MDSEKLKNKLIEYYNYEMRNRGNSNYSIDNIRIFIEEDKTYAFADIKYTWQLNAWEKAVKMNDVLFIVTSFLGFGEWKSPIFY